MKPLLRILLASSVLLLACKDNEAPEINLHVPLHDSFHSNDIELGIAFDLIGAEDLSSLVYAIKNTDTDSTYLSGDWMNISYTVDFIVVRDFLTILNLPEGTYTLEVEAKDDNDNYNSEQVTFNIID